MKNKEDLIQEVNKFIEKRMNGYAFNIDLEACRLLENLKEEVIKLREEREKKK
jgi:hypothetical protein